MVVFLFVLSKHLVTVCLLYSLAAMPRLLLTEKKISVNYYNFLIEKNNSKVLCITSRRKMQALYVVRVYMTNPLV